MAISVFKKVNPYSRIGSTIVNIMNDVGSIQAAVPGLTVETLASYVGDTADDYFHNQYQRNESTKYNYNGLASLAVNQFDVNVDFNMYKAGAIEQIINIPPSTSSSTAYLGYLNTLERNGHSCDISPEEQKIIFLLSAIGASIAQYWQDEKDAGASSDWNNYLGGASYVSGWTSRGLVLALAFIQRGATLEATIVAAIVGTIAEVSDVTI